MTTPLTFKIQDDSTSFMISYENREVYCKVPKNLINVNRKMLLMCVVSMCAVKGETNC